MSNRKSLIGKILIGIGAVLILSAGALALYNEHENRVAGRNADRALQQLTEAISKNIAEQSSQHETPAPQKDPAAPSEILPNEPEEVPEMDVVNIDGKDYIGYISVPSLELNLPILSGYVYEDLKTAPCRYSGSVYTDDLVIAGHNYRSHFNPLQNVEVGAEVIFMDVHGVTYKYVVADREVLEPSQIEDMIQSEYDLTLFTCTYGGQTRLAVRCLLAE